MKVTQWFLVAGLLGVAGGAMAGDLEPSGPPAPTMKSLDEVQPAWSQVLDASDGDPNGCNSSRFKCVMGDEAALDLETGLVWERDPGGTTTPWGGSLYHCLGEAVGGRAAWRSPTVHELRSLVIPAGAGNRGADSSLPDGHPFINIAGIFWTSSTDPVDTTDAFAMQISSGDLGLFAKTDTFSSWCVRGPGGASFTSQPNVGAASFGGGSER